MMAMSEIMQMPVYIRSNLAANVAPYFSQDLIQAYCYSIDEKEGKGLCTNDLKRDLVRIITTTTGNALLNEQRQAILYVENSIKSYDEKLEALWRELKEINLESDEDELISQPFYTWKAGTCKFDIWNW